MDGIYLREEAVNEKDLCHLRDALEKNSLFEAIKAVEQTLKEMGYEKRRNNEIQ